MSHNLYTDPMDKFYIAMRAALEEASDNMPIDLIYSIMSGIHKRIEVEYERAILVDIDREFKDATQPGRKNKH